MDRQELEWNDLFDGVPFGVPVVINDSIPPNEIRVTGGTNIVRLVNIGEAANPVCPYCDEGALQCRCDEE